MSQVLVPGLELAEHHYIEVVAPIADEALGGVPYSAALIGYGSELQGFDTLRSTDHARGPRTLIFLGDEGFGQHGARAARPF
ncbi:MAG TPA: hypothetical protein VH372_14640 [Actinospica sp.]|jgi:hypothetical protein|nr:hypothetical protein [Actinospica sp.]